VVLELVQSVFPDRLSDPQNSMFESLLLGNCFQDFSVLTNYEIGEAFCSALSIISYKLLETFLRHTLPIRNKPITVFALYDFSIKHQSSKLVTLHCWSPKCSVQRYFYKSGNT
jgi:hypothetical protein